MMNQAFQRKPYLYDLYRWTGKTDFKTFLKWRFVSKYNIVYLKRKCEQYRPVGGGNVCFI